MLTPPSSSTANGLDSDSDAAALLRKLARAILAACVVLALAIGVVGLGVRPSVFLAGLVAIVMLVLVQRGRVKAAAYTLCWGLLVPASVAISMYGIRSTGALLIPLAIMSGGWLLGRLPAVVLAVAGCLLSIGGYLYHANNPASAMPPVTFADVLGHFAVFLVTALLATAMVGTLRRQYDKVSRLADGLKEANATLEHRVAERSAQLASMQQKLLDTEKLTSLGAMVAGISHELNTPLGNALTMTTTLEAKVRSLTQRMESGKLTRTDMTEYLTGAAAMTQLATQSVSRASDLVDSFKQVALEQTAQQKRNFQLDQIVAESVATLSPTLEQVEPVVTIDIAEGINCYTYPEPLGQVIANLLQNALVHGLDGQTQGQVKVSAIVQGDQVRLEVSDNGRGMEPKVLARVFEPFFTTRLGKGGSGLGLTLAHRIATTVLSGNLTVRSQLGEGSTFTLTFPMRSPGVI
jgi:signal transduction histidine kinase